LRSITTETRDLVFNNENFKQA